MILRDDAILEDAEEDDNIRPLSDMDLDLRATFLSSTRSMRGEKEPLPSRDTVVKLVLGLHARGYDIYRIAGALNKKFVYPRDTKYPPHPSNWYGRISRILNPPEQKERLTFVSRRVFGEAEKIATEIRSLGRDCWVSSQSIRKHVHVGTDSTAYVNGPLRIDMYIKVGGNEYAARSARYEMSRLINSEIKPYHSKVTLGPLHLVASNPPSCPDEDYNLILTVVFPKDDPWVRPLTERAVSEGSKEYKVVKELDKYDTSDPALDKAIAAMVGCSPGLVSKARRERHLIELVDFRDTWVPGLGGVLLLL